MRRIYKYNEQAKKYLSAIIKKKMPEAKPWLHVGVKTFSARNPFACIAIWIWDTRQVIWEHRFNNPNILTNEQMLIKNSGMSLALDNREPLVGGRPDVNEWMELGPEFDASHGTAFDGKDRVKSTKLYERRAAKLPKAGQEADLSDIAENGGQVDLSEYDVKWFKGADDKKYAIVCQNDMCYLFFEDGTMADLDDNFDNLTNDYQLIACEANGGTNSLYITNAKQCTIVNSDKPVDIEGIVIAWDPHGGIYFRGKTAKLKNLQQLIKEKTNFAEQ